MKKKTKLRKSARGQECMVRIPGVCNFNPETTVLAHLNGGGTGMKHSDLFGAFCCSDCHDAIDGRIQGSELTLCEMRLYHYDGIQRTQQWWLDNGYIEVR